LNTVIEYSLFGSR